VQNTEPEVLVGGITYHRQDDGVVFHIPVQSQVYPDFKTEVSVVVSDNGEIYYPITCCKEIYRKPEMFKHFFEEAYIDEVVLDCPIVSFRFHQGLYSPEFGCYLTTPMSIDLNLLTNEFSVEIRLGGTDWNGVRISQRLWELIRQHNRND